MRRVRVRLGNNRVEQRTSGWPTARLPTAQAAPTVPVGCRPDANPNPNHGLREGVVFLRARGRALDECSPFFVTLHFHSQAAKAGIAIAASAQTVKLWLLQEGAFVLH